MTGFFSEHLDTSENELKDEAKASQDSLRGRHSQAILQEETEATEIERRAD